MVRLDLRLETPEKDVPLGIYDLFVFFRKQEDRFVKLSSIIEGPLVNGICSSDPRRVIMAFRTDQEVVGEVLLQGKEERAFTDPQPTQKHEITLTGLEPDTEYAYSIRCGLIRTPSFRKKARRRVF